MVALANAMKEEGNALFKLKDYSSAYQHYSVALRGLQVRFVFCFV